MIPPIDDANRLPGIDLDGTDSDGVGTSSCVERNPDFGSLYEPTEHGIDNAIGALLSPSLVPLTAGATISDLIKRGRVALAIRVSGIDSYDDDDTVEVELGTTHVPGCDLAEPSTCVPVIDGTTLASGQPVVFVALGAPVSMTIVAGRLVGTLGTMNLPAALLRATGEPAELPVTVNDARIDTAISEDALDGALGGGLIVSDMLSRAFDPTVDPAVGRMVLETAADLDPSPSDPLICGALSIGVQLSAVRVTPIN
jgi:hypothetical protein